MPETLEVVLARVDERTKYMKGRLDSHIEDGKDIPARLAKLETNVGWMKRLGIGVPALLTAIIGGWKGLS